MLFCSLQVTNVLTNIIRINMDVSVSKSWTEIDAVKLVGARTNNTTRSEWSSVKQRYPTIVCVCVLRSLWSSTETEAAFCVDLACAPALLPYELFRFTNVSTMFLIIVAISRYFVVNWKIFNFMCVLVLWSRIARGKTQHVRYDYHQHLFDSLLSRCSHLF